MSELVIRTKSLSKQFNGKGGCRDITLNVPRGVIYGFLGPNGAGKSTFVRTLLGLLHPTGGNAEILGKPLNTIEVRRRIGYLPELFRYPDWLTGRQLLQAHADLLGLKPSARSNHISELLVTVGLHGRENDKIGKYSKGMQQRIGLACALLGDPELIFLDEPTSALDPVGRLEVRNLLAKLRQEGKTVFLNSHLLMEIETVCDEIAIINHGSLIIHGDWRQLAGPNKRYRLVAGGLDPQMFQALPYISTWGKTDFNHYNATPEGAGEWVLEVTTAENIASLVGKLSNQNVRIYELTPLQPHLEDIFMYWVNRKEPANVDNR